SRRKKHSRPLPPRLRGSERPSAEGSSDAGLSYARQVKQQFRQRLIPLFRLPPEGLQDDAVQLRRYFGIIPRRRFETETAAPNLALDLRGVRAATRLSASGHLVARAAGRAGIGPGGQVFLRELVRRNRP